VIEFAAHAVQVDNELQPLQIGLHAILITKCTIAGLSLRNIKIVIRSTISTICVAP